jgi:tRNA-intron endonuclease, archaea type
MKFPIYLQGERIFSNSQNAITLQKTNAFGEIKQGLVFYSFFEALYLIEKEKADLFIQQNQLNKKNQKITQNELLKIILKKDKEFQVKYFVFKDLRNKSYIVKTGSKFGLEFRVYDKGKINSHARWVVYIAKQSSKTNWKEFILSSRIAHSTAKKLLIAIIDSEENIIYYETDWVKP